MPEGKGNKKKGNSSKFIIMALETKKTNKLNIVEANNTPSWIYQDPRQALSRHSSLSWEAP